MAYDHDVVIAGGGMVGASLALALSRYSGGALRVLVVESAALPVAGKAVVKPAYRPSFDARSTALSQGSRRILEQLGVWLQLAEHVTPIDHIHVSDRGHFGSTLLHADEQGWDALGYVVENAWLGNVLLSALRDAPGVAFCCPASVESVVVDAESAQLSVREGGRAESLCCQLLVVADGADSALRRQLGVDTRVAEYGQAALIANVSFDKPHGNCAYERFTERGPMALLPLSASEHGEPRAALVWTLPDSEAAALLARDDEAFLQQLQRAFGYRQGRFTRVGQRGSYPLRLVEAEEQVRHHIVIMGNAARTLHPVAGQGFNLALRDVGRLSQILAAARERRQALGDLALLKQFAARQARDQRDTVMLSDRLPRLFSNRQPLLSLLRNLGLLTLDVTPPAKTIFVDRAAGMGPGVIKG